MKNNYFDRNKYTANQFLPYLCIYFITYVILFMMSLFYSLGNGILMNNTLNVNSIAINALIGLSLYYYLTHSAVLKQNFPSIPSNHIVNILFSIAFSLSSFCISSGNQLINLVIAFLFPIFIYFYEHLILFHKRLKFCLLYSFLLFIHPSFSFTIGMIGILFILSIKSSAKNISLLEVFKCNLLCIAITAFYTFPSFRTLLLISPGYEGFIPSYSVTELLSKFFIGSSGTLTLYVGFVILFSLILYFFSNEFTLKVRFKSLCILVVLVSCSIFSPLSYIVTLGLNVPSNIHIWNVIPLFFLLVLGRFGFESMNTLKKSNFIISSIAFTFTSCVASYVACQNHNKDLILLNFTFIFLTLLSFIYLRVFQNKFAKACLLFIIVIELCTNIFCITNFSFVNNVETHSTSSNETSSAQITDTDYYNFLQSHTNLEINSAISKLMEFENKGYIPNEKNSFRNNLEKANYLAHQIGVNEDLFITVNKELELQPISAVDINKLLPNMFHVSALKSQEYIEYIFVPFSIQNLEKKHYMICNDHTNHYTEAQDDNQLSTGYFLIYPQTNYSLNLTFSVYEVNESAFALLVPALNTVLDQQTTSVLYVSDYVGIILSFIAIFSILLSLVKNKKTAVHVDSNTNCRTFYLKPVFQNLHTHLQANYIYYLSFLLPFIIFIAYMVIFDCIPFGSNSYYDEDGLSSSLPVILDYFHNLKIGNTYFSFNGGYGYNMFATNPLLILLKPLTSIPIDAIPSLILIKEAFTFGFCGLSITYYLTHRLSGKKANKKDFRILFAVLLYTLNTYMLSIHGYTTWYYTILLLPMVLLAMDYLIYKNKYIFYIIILTIAIYSNLLITMYVCIFLCLYFFTYQFHNIKDFIIKGTRFALCSLLAALNSFFIISSTLFATYDSPYSVEDSILPSFHFHTNFLYQWSKHMIFSPSKSISANDGDLNIYFGITAFIIIILYFLTKIELKKKITNLLLILFMYLSFNEEVLSYIWSGFHYQSKVPNRYVFLLLFVLSVMSYETLCHLKGLKIKHVFITSCSCLVFFLLCNHFSELETKTPIIATSILLLIFAISFCLWNKKKMASYILFLTVVLTIELLCNMYFTIENWGLNSITTFNGYPNHSLTTLSELDQNKNNYRITFPASININNGEIYNVGSTDIFNSYVSNHQVNMSYYYGAFYGTNNILSNFTSTPLGNCLNGTKYIAVPKYATAQIKDLDFYQYNQTINDYYIFNNPYTLSIGVYAPFDIASLDEKDFEHLETFYNKLTTMYVPRSKDLFTCEYIELDKSLEKGINTFQYLDENNKLLSYEEAQELYNEITPNYALSPMKELNIKLNLSSSTNGFAYLYAHEFVALGDISKDKPVEFITPFPNPGQSLDKAYNYMVFHPEVMDNLYDVMSENQMTNVTCENNMICGETNYKKDGYTMLSLAADRNFTAYIDDVEVEIEDPYDGFMLIKTPAGKHTLTLKYRPYGLTESILASCFGFLLTIILIVINTRKKNQ